MYTLLRATLSFLFTICFRWKVSGTENIPKTGGVIIASNHISLWDPPVVGCASVRPVHFMAKEELFFNPVLRWIIVKLNAFPVRRGMADRNAIRKAVSLLEAEKVVGIFPEGTRNRTGTLGQPAPGLAMIARKAGCVIVPTAVIGTDRIFSNGGFLPKVKVKFGRPIHIYKGDTDKGELEMISSQVMQEIARLMAGE